MVYLAEHCISCVQYFRNTVDEWMVYYRQTMGISLPSHLRTSLSRSPSPLQGHPGSTRQLYSSRSYAGELNSSLMSETYKCSCKNEM